MTPNDNSQASGGVVRFFLALAYVAPALAVVVSGVLEAMGEKGAPASTVLTLVAALSWIGLSLWRKPLREFLLDLGEYFLSRVPFVIHLLVAVLVLLIAVGSPGQLPWLAATLGFAWLCAASAVFTTRTDPKLMAKIGALLLVNLVIFTLADVAVRMVILPGKSHNSIFIAHDDYVGWKLRPDFTVDRKVDGGISRETINSLGYRSPEVPVENPSGIFRIVVIGDSHTEGYTVSDGETYPERLQYHLSKQMPVEVISFGVGGYATDQELLTYLHYARQFKPDLVVLQFCGNDVAFNTRSSYYRGNKPWFRRFGETLLLEGVPVPNAKRLGFSRHPLLRHSAIALVLDAVLSRIDIERDVTVEVDMEEAWHVTDLLLRDFRQIVESDGARIVMIHSGPDALEVDARVRAIAKANSIPFIDLMPSFEGDLERYRVTNDRHWNQAGHEAVGRFLASALVTFLGERE